MDRFPRCAVDIRARLNQRDTQRTVTQVDQGASTWPSQDGVKTAKWELSDQQVLAGRYRIDRFIGQGGFGRVYLSFDLKLHRAVAIKVPDSEHFRSPEDTESFLIEARSAAALDHPHIVPVYDAGQAEAGAVFVVMKFIDGQTLAELISQGPAAPALAANLVRDIASALEHAHSRRVIHRDIKPANILIDRFTAEAFLTDFGLAVREESDSNCYQVAGTPPYMSPEQACGESHRLDARSDLFSLGSVFYELLTARRAFTGASRSAVLQDIVATEPPPPRALSPQIPTELERICLKLLNKQASDRYPSATALVEDLTAWISAERLADSGRSIVPVVVPRGLRCFDADDKDFFLSLLPGPRNRAGVPEGLAFWQERVEQRDPEQTFSVGLIYGPSGCGKSSLVKAGLLPRLRGVVPILVEASPDETEPRLIRALTNRIPDLRPDDSLPQMLAAVRRRAGDGTKPKILLAIDQFEQWLQANPPTLASPLVAALRQCDGGRLQAILMIRDDFAMATTRFMDAVDVPILQGQNFGVIDRFEIGHAAKVLTQFGRGYGQLPPEPEPLSVMQREFVKKVAEGLAQDGRVVPVRLALFAEMVKSKTWHPATLREMGGMQGIGVRFLEEAFSGRSANPTHRRYAWAAERILRVLLPDVGSDIKGRKRSVEDLSRLVRFSPNSNDWSTLQRVLGAELRLITPTDNIEEVPALPDAMGKTKSDGLYFQLTHDYLVPPLRVWLRRRQGIWATILAWFNRTEHQVIAGVTSIVFGGFICTLEALGLFALTVSPRASEAMQDPTSFAFAATVFFLAGVVLIWTGSIALRGQLWAAKVALLILVAFWIWEVLVLSYRVPFTMGGALDDRWLQAIVIAVFFAFTSILIGLYVIAIVSMRSRLQSAATSLTPVTRQ